MKYWLVFILGTFFSLSSCNDVTLQKDKKIDLQQIRQRGKLIVLTENSSLSYFEYRDRPLGFEYEILDTFARSLGLKLEMRVVPNYGDLIESLLVGKGDLVAANLAVSLHDQVFMAFSKPYYKSYQVVVQLQSDSVIAEASELMGQEVWIRKNTAYHKRLRNLQEEIGAKVKVQFANDDLITEDLIEQVVQGKIRFTIAHENLARVSKEHHPNLDIKTRLSVFQNIAFGLRKNSPELREKLNSFLMKYCESEHFSALKHQYFDYLEPALTEILPIGRGQISPYDKLFKKAAKKYNFDWKLLAAIVYRESRFNPYTRGAGGAYGLMQFMPNTGPSYGVYPHSNPEIQINGGMRFIRAVYYSWSEIEDKEQRIKFTLASYNAGGCHIKDAQALAQSHGLNPLIWDNNVELMVEKLADPAYYRAENVKCGAYRGGAVNYVESVFSRYQAWK